MRPIRKQIADCLRHVDDPELGVNIVDLGLLYDLRFKEGDLTIKMTMTTPACPLGAHIKQRIRQLMGRVNGVDRVHIDTVWHPSWSPEMMAPSVRQEGLRPPRHA